MPANQRSNVNNANSRCETDSSVQSDKIDRIKLGEQIKFLIKTAYYQ